MQFLESSPRDIAAYPNFLDAITDLRRQELGVFSDGPTTVDIDAYDALWLNGGVDAYVVLRGNSMRGFAVIRQVPAVRRADRTFQVEAMWVANRRAAQVMWRNIRDIYSHAPLIAVAPIGSPYDKQLASHATHTHNTYVFEPRGTGGPAAAADAPPATD
jgi:hypothetical protein